MSIIHCCNKGSLQKKPYVLHTGDVKSASKENPGKETIKVNTSISINYGGPVAIVFSVYSAIANGPVAIASLKPVMRLQYQDQIIDCALDLTKDHKALQKYVYTYVLGMATIRASEVEIMSGGMVSEPQSEATPWLEWDKAGNPKITMDGPAVMKGKAGNLLVGLINIGNRKKYEVE
jgi:tellurite resistance protein TerA